MFYDTLKKISEGGRRLTIVIAGNHDNPERLCVGDTACDGAWHYHGRNTKDGDPKRAVWKLEVCRSGEGCIRIKNLSKRSF